LKSYDSSDPGGFYKPGRLKPLLSLIFIIFLLAIAPHGYAQDSPITVTVNKNHYTTDELVTLSVTVIDASPEQPRPILPELDGLAVIDFNIASNVSTVQGQIYTEVVYTYKLQPRRTGSLIIPSIPVKIDGQVFKSAPISIMVTQGSPPAPSPGNAVAPQDIIPPSDLTGQDFFVEALVDIPSPYIGQQFIYTFRFYQAIQVHRQPQFEMPIFNGLETIGLPVQEYNLDLADRTYLITEIRTALFPKTVGSIHIGPARLMFPGNYFEQPIELYTEPLTLQVKPLPDNAPPGFAGAVGQYTIEAWFSPQVAVHNQPSTYSVVISGVGNVRALPQPIWPPLHEWRTYDSLTSMTTDIKDGQMVGTRVYERLIISDQLGDITIAPTTFVYFDPIAAEYRTISTKPLSVRVIPVPTPNPATATAIATAPTATPIAALDSSAAPTPPNNQFVNRVLADSLEPAWQTVVPFGLILVAACGAIPLAMATGAGGLWLWQKRQQRLKAEAEALKSPGQKMHEALLKALPGNDDNYRVVSRALNAYLSEVLQAPTKGLTRTELAKQLQKRGLDKAQIDKINDYLAQSEMGRFGPKTDDAGWELLAKTDALLFELDVRFGKRKTSY
jgi:hypothetical protein